MNRLNFQRKRGKNKIFSIVVWLIEIAFAGLLAWLTVMLFFQRVSSAGDSMNPTLGNGDVVLIDRLVYQIKNPKRGDIIAFRLSGNRRGHYLIKRVAGLPGETIQIKDGSVFIDGEEVSEHIYAEDIKDAGTARPPLQLGEDEYFVLGDNPSGSNDSRTADIGNVKKEDIYGRVWLAVSPKEKFGFLKR